LDAISKALGIKHFYSADPCLRREIRELGGLGKLWEACHNSPTGQDVLRARQCPKNRPVNKPDISAAEKAWNDLLRKLQDLALTHPDRALDLQDDMHLGTWLAFKAGLPWLLQHCPTLRTRIRQSGGLCKLYKTIQWKQAGQAFLTPNPKKVLRLADVLTDHTDNAPDFGIATPEVWPQSWVGG